MKQTGRFEDMMMPSEIIKEGRGDHISHGESLERSRERLRWHGHEPKDIADLVRHAVRGCTSVVVSGMKRHKEPGRWRWRESTGWVKVA